MPVVTVNVSGVIKKLAARDGENLGRLLAKNGLPVPMPCGGRGECGKCLAVIDGKKQLVCQYTVSRDITVGICEKEISSVPGMSAAAPDCGEDFYFALDIGTTTLALAKCSPGGEVLSVLTANNPQSVYGADVMTRISYGTANGVGEMKDCLINGINGMLAKMETGKNKPPMFVSGNTTMLHIFMGEDVSSLGVFPYSPVFLEGRTTDGKTAGLKSIGEIRTLPCIASFVGADITAGLLSLPVPPKGVFDILIDLGTNAEIALFGENGAVCTSAAAGPCFEGVNITCGMPASSGAVCSFGSDGARTVNDAPPEGICATGLIDAVAYCLDNGIIDETGLMEDDCFDLGNGVALYPKDVRQFQLAKSAVFTALNILMREAGVTPAGVRRFYVAGGFSDKLNVASAVRSGLFPGALASKFIPVNNSSLSGTVRYGAGAEIRYASGNCRFIDPAAADGYNDSFMENIMFE